jgi:hypothetical protein
MPIQKKTITITVKTDSLIASLRNPYDDSIFHLETILPFSEANKLIPGTANVRKPRAASRPYRKMIETVELSPRTFHAENRGIVFVCEDFDVSEVEPPRKNKAGKPGQPTEKDSPGLTQIVLTVEDNSEDLQEEDARTRTGIADGGHTFAVIAHTMEHIKELQEKNPEWREPHVRVKIMLTRGIDINRVVEALNTSTQVKDYTLDDYRSEFDGLKQALADQQFDTKEIAWRENDTGYWDIREIVQRLALFIPDKPNFGPRLYKSRQSALRMYMENRKQFSPLLPLAKDLAFLPELIEAQFSSRENIKARMRLGSLRAAKGLSEERQFPSLGLSTKYAFNLAATLPIAGAFRELLIMSEDTVEWEVDHREALSLAAEDLYRALTDTLATIPAGNIGSMGSNQAYWSQCSNVMLRVKGEMLKRQSSKDAEPKTETVKKKSAKV